MKQKHFNKKIYLRFHQLGVFLKFCFYWCYCQIFRIRNDSMWLLSERGDEARDNGYAFYKYLIQNHPDQTFRYVITKDSADLSRFHSSDHLVYYGSREHYILFITSGCLISSHVMGYSPDFRLFTKLDKWGLLKVRGKKVFLSHGINKDDRVDLHHGNIHCDLLISGAKPEYEYMVDTYGYPKGAIQYTGMARYDYLKKKEKKQILIMPTWRTNMFYCSSIQEFQQSFYFKCWYGILNDSKLSQLLKEYGYSLVFYPHYEFQPYLEAFDMTSDVITIADFDHYDVQTLLNESSLLITDYSSVFFDVAYIDKPVIFYQFDLEEYRSVHYQEGFFSYERDGFGPICQTKEEVLDCLTGYFEHNFQVEKVYRQNKERFFTLSPHENSKRVYEAIIHLMNRGEEK